MTLSGAKVVFRRFHGRVVPMLSAYGAVAGASLGAAAAMDIAGRSQRMQKARETMMVGMQKRQVDARKLIAKSGLKDVTLIANRGDLKKNFSFLRRWQLGGVVDETSAGRNAAAARIGKRDYLFAAKKSNASVVGHELGHIKDFRVNGPPLVGGALGVVSGAILRVEKRAWQLSTTKNYTLKKPALTTYEVSQKYARRGALVGGVTGLLGYKTLLKYL